MESRSSPVAGTIIINGLRHVSHGSPVAEPVEGTTAPKAGLTAPDPLAIAAQALAQAAQALAAVATALAQKTPVNIGYSHPLTPAPPPAPPAGDQLTLTQLISEFLRAKARAGKSDRYLRTLKNSLSKFNAGRGRLPLSAISHATIESFLDKGGAWSPRTRKGYLGDVSTLLNFAVRRGYLSVNPARGVERCEQVDKAPALHTPDQVAAVLEYARGVDLNLCRSLAIRYFAGLRSIEVERLSETEIFEGHIEVTARKAKTRSRRIVTIQPALAAWLALGGSVEFGDHGTRSRRFNKAIATDLAIPWPYNVARHSFISYHLAGFESAAKTALQAGTSEAMVFQNYRELVTSAAAARFWSIRPR